MTHKSKYRFLIVICAVEMCAAGIVDTASAKDAAQERRQIKLQQQAVMQQQKQIQDYRRSLRDRRDARRRDARDEDQLGGLPD